jgi:hypothetical protein
MVLFSAYPKIREEFAFLECAAKPHTLKMRFFYERLKKHERLDEGGIQPFVNI